MRQDTPTVERTHDHRFLTVKELATALHVSVRWVHERTRRQEIPCYRAGSLLRFDLGEVLAWMRQQRAS